MTSSITFSILSFFSIFLSFSYANLIGNYTTCAPNRPSTLIPAYPRDVDQMKFALNLEFVECEWFLHGSLGIGLDQIEPELARGGPPPIGARRANLDNQTRRIIEEFGYQEVGHIRAIKSTVGGITRPLIDLSAANFARVMDEAFGYHLNPPFNPYNNSLNYLLASYMLPYLGINSYTGTNPGIDGCATRRLLAGLLGVEAGQDAVIRTILYQRKQENVPPYRNKTVADFTVQISALRNRLGMCGIKDEGLIVPRELGAEMRTTSNVLSANGNSLSYVRTPRELLRILYLTGDEHIPGGFLPKGGNGRIARMYLNSPANP